MIKKSEKLVAIPLEIFRDRKLIARLAYNDFKQRFAGSFFGLFWAFVQPVVTIVVFWFVFEHGLNAGRQQMADGITVPFVLFLVSGLVPWFFFSDALSNGTNSLIAYNYLVKKVVFHISILPIVKVAASLFVHLFFLTFAIILFMAYGFYPDLHTLQVVYYSFALFVLVLGVSYLTCSVVVFFRDLTEIINIVLQVGMWATPIMWNIHALNPSPLTGFLIRLNPIYYIVSGYRDAFINKIWFWERPEVTIYFWMVTIVIGTVGFLTFRRLKIHFADVL
ncbi:MAG: ABC transporter permease [Lachnospiraceae bacterium]|nr:ABC transporter permease [Lachnospiraceae bacterium]